MRARTLSPDLVDSPISCWSCFIRSSSDFISSGREIRGNRTAEADSSIKSIALSGKNLSPTYRLERRTAASTAASGIWTLWNASYLPFNAFSIFIACSSVGSGTTTGWNLLSRAGSFSIYFLYSVSVVAPIICISPLDKPGFSRFPASPAPSPPATIL